MLLTVLFGIEAYCVTYYIGNTGGFLNTSILFIGAGFLVCALPFLTVRKQSISAEKKLKRFAAIHLMVIIAALVTLTLYCMSRAFETFPVFPIDYQYADMFPQIRICCQRLLNNERVYAPMPQIWNGMKPTYLPMMWLPFIPFEIWTNDLRWTVVIALIASLVTLASVFPFRRYTVGIPLLIAIAAVGWMVHFWFEVDKMLLVHVEEPLVIAFYLLLAFGLIKSNPWVVGVSMGCCVLSRYVLLFWIPAYLLFVYLYQSKHYAWRMFGIVTAMVMFIFVLPFFVWQPQYFIDSINHYHYVTMDLMKRDPVFSFQPHLGLAKLFTYESVNWLIRLETLSAIVPPFIALGLFKLWDKRFAGHKEFFGLCSLKLTMVFFYAFVEIPFNYLFFVPAFFTLPICLQAYRRCS